MDSESTRLLWDLRAALIKAMTESSDMRRVLDRLRGFGWSAYLVIDEAETEPATASSRLASGAGADSGDGGESCGRELNGADLAFLRSLGIDPEPDSSAI